MLCVALENDLRPSFRCEVFSDEWYLSRCREGICPLPESGAPKSEPDANVVVDAKTNRLLDVQKRCAQDCVNGRKFALDELLPLRPKCKKNKL
jgi:hypothetical protein